MFLNYSRLDQLLFSIKNLFSIVIVFAVSLLSSLYASFRTSFFFGDIGVPGAGFEPGSQFYIKFSRFLDYAVRLLPPTGTDLRGPLHRLHLSPHGHSQPPHLGLRGLPQSHQGKGPSADEAREDNRGHSRSTLLPARARVPRLLRPRPEGPAGRGDDLRRRLYAPLDDGGIHDDWRSCNPRLVHHQQAHPWVRGHPWVGSGGLQRLLAPLLGASQGHHSHDRVVCRSRFDRFKVKCE